jgi:hypothetical protein
VLKVLVGGQVRNLNGAPIFLYRMISVD